MMSLTTHRTKGPITFSLWEKVPEGRMRGLRPEGVAQPAYSFAHQSPHPAQCATFSQREKEELRPASSC